MASLLVGWLALHTETSQVPLLEIRIERLREHLKNGKGIDSRKYVTKQGYRYVGDKRISVKVTSIDWRPSVGSLIQSTKDGKNAYSSAKAWSRDGFGRKENAQGCSRS